MAWLNYTRKLKPKDLLPVPWMVAMALQADGWYLRSDVIWSKLNPMPESVTDRPTSAHEHVFLLAKSPRYFYDADAIREDVAPSQVGRVRADPIGGKSWRERQQHDAGGVYRTGGLNGGRIADDVDEFDGRLTGKAREGSAQQSVCDEQAHGFQPFGGVGFVRSADVDDESEIGAEAGEGFSTHADSIPYTASNSNPGRNRRNVWSIATQPYPEAHFATFPTKLVEPCVLAGSSPTACGGCGAGFETRLERHATTIGWQPSCSHNDDTGRSVILDPFAGSGTVGVVALRHDRSFIGIELSSAYCEMARERIRGDQPLFNHATEVTT